MDPFLNQRERNYGPAGFDRRHVFSVNFFWTLPPPGRALGIRPLGWLTDDWTVSGVARLLSGGPTTPTYSLVNGIANPTGSGDDTARPQVIKSDGAAPAALRSAAGARKSGETCHGRSIRTSRSSAISAATPCTFQEPTTGISRCIAISGSARGSRASCAWRHITHSTTPSSVD